MSQTTVAPVSLADKLAAAKHASLPLATATTDRKDAALREIASALLSSSARILEANELALAEGRDNGLSSGLLDRLTLTDSRLRSLADAVLQVVSLADPVGQVVRGSALPN